MDDVDRTTERQEREAKYLLQASRRPAGPVPNGTCYYCEAPIAVGAFCDGEHRDRWEYEQRRMKANGK